jgi:hypothetical protein
MADDDTPADRYPDSEGPFAGPNNTFPLNTAGRVKNAWARIHQGPTRANHSAAEIASIMSKIKARAKDLGIELEEHDGAPAGRALGEGDTIESRVVISPVELRALPDGAEGSRWIGGYAAVFNRESRMISDRFGFGPYVERVTPTFFEEARSAGWPGNQGSGVLCRYNHNDQYLLGTTAGGTCELGVDATGLEYRTLVPRCREDVLELVGRRDIRQSSFTFMDAQDDWNYTGGVTHRTLLTGGVLDVAPVSAVCAYEDTTVGLRSLAAHKDVPVDDVFNLAKQNELRKLFTRTDQTPAPGPLVHIEKVLAAPTEQRTIDAESAPPAQPEPEAPAEPQPDTPPDTPPAEEPVTLSWQEAHLRVLAMRPYDPIRK